MSKLLPYETIVKAHEGDPDAIDTILSHYAGYIRYCSKVHGKVNAAFKISNLSVFTTKLDYNISLRDNLLNSSSSRNNFLNKRNVKPVRHRKTARTGNLYSKSLFISKREFLFNIIKSRIYNLNNCAADICTMSLVIAIDELIIMIQNRYFYSSRTDINTHAQWDNFFICHSFLF